MESQQFLELTPQNLSKILEKDKLEVLDETQLFDAVMRFYKTKQFCISKAVNRERTVYQGNNNSEL